MAKVLGNDCRLYVGGYDATGSQRQIDVAVQVRDVLDATSLIDQAERVQEGGIERDEFSHSGFFDDATSAIDALLTANMGSTHVFLLTLGTAIGKNAIFGGAALAHEYKRGVQLGDFFLSGATYASDVAWDFKGKLYLPKTTISSFPHSGTITNDGGSSSSGGVAVVQVVSITNGTNITVSIRDSNDNFSGDDNELLAFTAITTASARGAQRVTVAGTVERYLRINVAQTGGVTQAVVVVAFERS